MFFFGGGEVMQVGNPVLQHMLTEAVLRLPKISVKTCLAIISKGYMMRVVYNMKYGTLSR